jgi:hypothetical protein
MKLFSSEEVVTGLKVTSRLSNCSFKDHHHTPLEVDARIDVNHFSSYNAYRPISENAVNHAFLIKKIAVLCLLSKP